MIHAIFSMIKDKNVLVCGDVMLDRYLLGRVNRISPEAPVPILNYEHTENRLGGAANVSLNIAALRARTHTCGIIGNDENGTIFNTLMAQHGLSHRYMVKSNERQTTTKTRVIANKHHLLRVDREDTFNLSESEKSAYLDIVQKCLNENAIDVMIIQDYNKGVLTPEVIDALLKLAKKHGIYTAVDPKKSNFLAYKGVNLFKPNLKEVSEALGLTFSPTLKDLDRAAGLLQKELNHGTTLITLSEHGLYIGDANSSQIIPTRKRNIVDVCGAGDTVLSIAALSLSQGVDYHSTGILSNLAGGQVCERVGVVPLELDQLMAESD